MKVLITGATGFLGSWVVEQLVDGPGVAPTGATGDIAVLLRPGADTWRIAPFLDRLRVIEGDLASPESPPPLAAALAAFRPDAVAHLAWQGVAGADRNSPVQWRNIPATLQLAELCAAAGARHFIGLGSQAEYGPCNAVIDENTPERPTTLYGASKLATARVAQRLCEIQGMRFAWLRLFSSYGPRDNPSWMIPGLIRSLLAGEVPQVTLAEQRWDYIHVADAAAAVVAVLRTPGASGIFNLGSGNAPPLRDVIGKLRDLVDPRAQVAFGAVPYRPDQVMHLQADIRRLSGATGWRPVVALDDGLRETVQWFRSRVPVQ